MPGSVDHGIWAGSLMLGNQPYAEMQAIIEDELQRK